MILNIILIVIGIVLVVKGADWLTNGAVSVATKLHISQMVIGLTIVAMGTSMPEFCVSFVSALKGTPDLAVGNVVGSNIFNALLIVGVAAMVAPMAIMKKTVKVDIPVGVVASLLLLILCLDGSISRFDAGAMFLLFLMYMYYTVKGAKKGSADSSSSATVYSGWKSALLMVVGLAGLIGGSEVFVEGATKVAQALGVSDAIIGLTIVAGGTSLPDRTARIGDERGLCAEREQWNCHWQCLRLEYLQHPDDLRRDRVDLSDVLFRYHLSGHVGDGRIDVALMDVQLHEIHSCPLGRCRLGLDFPRLPDLFGDGCHGASLVLIDESLGSLHVFV